MPRRPSPADRRPFARKPDARKPIARKLVAAGLLALAATAALAAADKPKRPRVVPPAPAVVAAPVATAAPPLAAPPTILGLSRLSSTGDAGPVCRATCATERYTCESGSEDDGCGARWGTCVQACAGPSGGASSGLALSSTLTPR